MFTNSFLILHKWWGSWYSKQYLQVFVSSRDQIERYCRVHGQHEQIKSERKQAVCIVYQKDKIYHEKHCSLALISRDPDQHDNVFVLET